MRRINITICAMMLVVVTLQAQDLPFDSSVAVGSLSNGFTYYIRYNAEPKNRVVMYLANKVGSLQEDNDQRGLAHFLEHMSFNGTKHFPENKLLDYLQKSGVRFGADINAYTGFGETVYQLPLPSDDSSIVTNGLQIMRDWAADALLENIAIDNERGVVLEEKRMHAGAQQRMMEKLWPLQTNHSRYAERIPIGLEKVIKTFKRADIIRFYRDWYRPGLQAIIVVGDIDVVKVEMQIRQLFSGLKNPVKPRRRVEYVIPLTGKNQFIALSDEEQTTTSLQVVIKQPALQLKSRVDFRKNIVRNLSNMMLADRLAEWSRRPNLPYAQAQAAIEPFIGGLDAFSVVVTAKQDKLKKGFETVWRIIEQFRRHGVTASELLRKKESYLKQMKIMLQEKNKTPSLTFVEELLQHFLKGTAVPGIEKEYEMVRQDLGSINAAEVNREIARFIKNTDRDIIILAPKKDAKGLPTETEINAWIKKIQGSPVEAYAYLDNEQQLMTSLPHSGSIVSNTYDKTTGITRLMLSNGARVFVKPTDFKNDEILFSLFSEGGTSVYPDSIFYSAATAGQLIAAGGVSNYSQTALMKILSSKSVDVDPYIDDCYEGMTGRFVPEDMETGLQLIYLRITSPRLDSSLFNNIITGSSERIANRRNDPAAVFEDSANAILGNYHYRSTPFTLEKLRMIKMDQMLQVYRERFADAGNFTFVFTGNIDTSKFFPLIAQYIASLPSSNKVEKARDLHIDIPQGNIERTIYKGRENKAIVRLVFSGDYDFNATNNMLLTALRAVLQYRITDRIREAEGGAYAPQVFINYNRYPSSRYSFTLMFTCAPQNTRKLVAAAREEIDRLATSGPPEGDIAKFVAEQTRMSESNLRKNRFWVNAITQALQNDYSVQQIVEMPMLLKTVTKTAVQNAATQYLKTENYIELVLMPEKHSP